MRLNEFVDPAAVEALRKAHPLTRTLIGLEAFRWRVWNDVGVFDALRNIHRFLYINDDVPTVRHNSWLGAYDSKLSKWTARAKDVQERVRW